MANYVANRFGKFTYNKVNAGNARYLFIASDGSRTVKSPIMREDARTLLEYKWENSIKNMMGYIDYGRDAYDRMTASAIVAKMAAVNLFGGDKISIAFNIFSAFTSDTTTDKKALDVAKAVAGSCSTPILLDGFFIGDFTLVAVNKINCSDVLETLANLPIYQGDPGVLV